MVRATRSFRRDGPVRCDAKTENRLVLPGAGELVCFSAVLENGLWSAARDAIAGVFGLFVACGDTGE